MFGIIGSKELPPDSSDATGTCIPSGERFDEWVSVLCVGWGCYEDVLSVAGEVQITLGLSVNRRVPSQKSRNPVPKTVLSDGTVLYSSYPKRVEDVPLEYQAAVHAKNQREQAAKRESKARVQLEGLRSALRALKIKLRDTPVGAERANLEKEIKAQEKVIRKFPKPKRKWSPVLSGSFESGSQ